MNLKPCPFCGSTNAVIYAHHWTGHGEGGTLYYATCKQCDARVTSRADGWPHHQEKATGEAGAISAWNKRSDDVLGEAVKLLREMRDWYPYEHDTTLDAERECLSRVDAFLRLHNSTRSTSDE